MHGVTVPDTWLSGLVDHGAGEYWWELTASLGTLEVRRRRLPGGTELEAIKGVECDHESGSDPEHGPWCYGFDETDYQLGLFDGLVQPRGEITEWSAKSRQRMLKRLATLDFGSQPGIWEMVTLTYPRSFPTNGRVCKAHLLRFKKRYKRQWGSAVGTWKFEFQDERRAPHFHVYITRPADSSIRKFMGWVSSTWYEIVASGDERHLRAGTGVDKQFCSRSAAPRAIAWYFAKHHGHKSVQNIVPQGFRNCGRFWGVWGMVSTEQTVEISPEAAADLKRVMRSCRRSEISSDRQLRLRPDLANLWVLAWDPVKILRRLIDHYQGPEFLYLNERTGELRRWRPGRPRPLP